ncbi:MAG: hypothetical protein WBN49_08525 [Arenicellales bacterium]
MIRLTNSLNTWGSPAFENSFRDEIEALDSEHLPLQQGLTQSSYVSDSGFSVVILNSFDTAGVIQVKTGVFYSGVIAGSCCSDDPTPLNEQTEYCEMQVEISKSTAEAKITLLTT